MMTTLAWHVLKNQWCQAKQAKQAAWLHNMMMILLL
jgi:hypothetical protein